MHHNSIRAGAMLALIVIACVASDADARGRRHHYYLMRGQLVDLNGDSSVDDERTPRRASVFGATAAHLIRQCRKTGLELKNWPIDEIATSVSPDESQRVLLEQVHRSANSSAQALS